MYPQFRVFLSNRLERLYCHLKEALFGEETRPFTKRKIATPSPAIKDWLLTKMADDLGIAAGFDISYLGPMIESFQREFFGKRSFSYLELAFYIEGEIRRILSSSTAELEDSTWAPLYRYVYSSSREKTSRRLVRLSATLARLFLQYEKFGIALLQRWLNNQRMGWQAELWKRVVGKIPSDQIEQQDLGDRVICVFSEHFISQRQYRFLLNLSQSVPVNLFVLSPCQAFWSDVLSDRESGRLQTFWEEKGASTDQQLALEDYLYSRNPLLANFGRLGREMAIQIEETECQTYEDFQEPGTAPSLLAAVQSDLLHLHSPKHAAISSEEESIQLHIAPSPMREVDILYNTLMVLIDKHNILPKDILVMAPNIMEYAPYIRAVFERKESQLACSITDLSLLSDNPLVQGLFYVLSLAFGRWDLASLLHLLDFPFFLERHRFSSEDARHICTWMKEAGIRWGIDIEHRMALLHQSEGDRLGFIGTWEHGFERLLWGLAMTETEGASVLPAGDLDITDAEVLGRWIYLIRSLYKDLIPLTDGSAKNPKQWTQYLEQLVSTYFYVAEDGEVLRDLFSQFSHLSTDDVFPFSTIRYYLEEAANRQGVGYHTKHLHAVHFCSFQAPPPSQVIALLGMQQGCFPRQEMAFSLNAMLGQSDVDYCPTQTDSDRYLFLTALLSTRDYFVMSYHQQQETDAPSLLITEFFSYLDKGYLVGETSPSKHCTSIHPYSPYDKRYFSEGKLHSYSFADYRAAQAFYNGVPQPLHCFISNFHIKQQPRVEPGQIIDLKQLTLMARKPVDAFFRQRLGMYHNGEEETYGVEEDFLFSPLRKMLLNKEALKKPIEEVIKQAEREGHLPLDPFKQYAIAQLKKESAEWEKTFASFAVSEMFSVTLSTHCDRPVKTETGWELPPLPVPYRNEQVDIIGVLEQVTPAGLVAFIEDDKHKILKVWPQFLVYTCLREQYKEFFFKDRLLLMKSGVEKSAFFSNPFEELTHYLDYYFHALENISPLLPEWVPSLLEGEKAFEKKVSDSFSQHRERFYHPSLKWVMQGSTSFNVQAIFDEWNPLATKLYGKLYEEW